MADFAVLPLLNTHGEDTMIKDRHTKESRTGESSRSLVSKPAASSTPPSHYGSYSMSAPSSQVAESPTQNWKKYTDSRMRQFSGGR